MARAPYFAMDALSSDGNWLKRFGQALASPQIEICLSCLQGLCCEPTSASPVIARLAEHFQPQLAAFLTLPLQGLPEVRNETDQSVLPPRSAGSKGVTPVPLMAM